MNKQQKPITPVLATAFVLAFTSCECKGPHAPATNQVPAAISPIAPPLENGAYAIIREAPTPQDARAGVPHVVLAYDRRKYSDAPPSEPLTYVAIDPGDYVPLIIEGTPEMKSDGQGKSVLTVSLARKNAEKAETFTRAHLGGR
jgi:hypothetical protein